MNLPFSILPKILSYNLTIDDFKSLRETSKCFKRIDTLQFWKIFYSISIEKAPKYEICWKDLTKLHYTINDMIGPNFRKYDLKRHTHLKFASSCLIKTYLKLIGIDVIPGINNIESVKTGENYTDYLFPKESPFDYLDTFIDLCLYERKDYCWHMKTQHPQIFIKDMAKILLKKPSKNFFQKIQSILEIFQLKRSQRRGYRYTNTQSRFVKYLLNYILDDVTKYKRSDFIVRLKDMRNLIKRLEMGPFIAKYGALKRITMPSPHLFTNRECIVLAEIFLKELMKE